MSQPQILLPLSPSEATKLILKKLPTRRMRDVVERRFGLKGGKIATLDAIGKEYKITRERVRQIEADALKFLRKDEQSKELEELFVAIETYLKERGGVMAEHHLLQTCSQPPHHQYLLLLLDLGKPFHRISETEEHHNRWALEKDRVLALEKVMAGTVRDLEKLGRTVTQEELYETAGRNAEEVFGQKPESHLLETYLATSKSIKQNPYGEFGLAWWPMISPSGVKDKAYAALLKSGQPMHFREVAQAVNNAGWSKRKAHPQTVHNELIKDSRFVLVGRGLYALREWGYEPGAVRDVLLSVFKEERYPLTKEQIIRLVLAKRAVKPQTILLNLQNKSLFKKTENGEYVLAEA